MLIVGYEYRSLISIGCVRRGESGDAKAAADSEDGDDSAAADPADGALDVARAKAAADGKAAAGD